MWIIFDFKEIRNIEDAKIFRNVLFISPLQAIVVIVTTIWLVLFLDCGVYDKILVYSSSFPSFQSISMTIV